MLIKGKIIVGISIKIVGSEGDYYDAAYSFTDPNKIEELKTDEGIVGKLLKRLE